ncbi:MAG: hypothetical protein AB7T63_06955 [Planctomycetota bacterium]
MDAHALPSLIAAALAGGLAVAVAARRRRRQRVAGHRRTGRRGTARGLRVLEAAGYRIVAEEVVREGVVRVDGREERFLVRADALVERRGLWYVAELKGSPLVASALHRATRRQLLEYAVAFGVAGVLLVDAARGRVHVVGFDDLPERPRRGRARWRASMDRAVRGRS